MTNSLQITRLVIAVAILLAPSSLLRMRGQVLPYDSMCQTKWIVDADISDDVQPGDTIDLSMSSITDRFETHYRVYGDTLVSAYELGRKEWLTVRKDGVWVVGINDRLTQGSFSNGLMRLPSNESTYTSSDTLTVLDTSSPQTNEVAMSAISTVSYGNTVILPGGEAADADLLLCENIEIEGGDNLARSSWYVDGLFLPVLQKDIYRSGDNMQTVVTICPPSEQPSRQEANARSAASVRHGRPSLAGNGNNGTGIEGLTVSVSTDMVSARIHEAWPDSATVILYDDLGRMVRTGNTGDISTAGLPNGYYMVGVYCNGRVQEKKIAIR